MSEGPSICLLTYLGVVNGVYQGDVEYIYGFLKLYINVMQISIGSSFYSTTKYYPNWFRTKAYSLDSQDVWIIESK